ncbi:metal ABC transporter substrate-binding protein [Enterococcus sp. CWB-B31]|uniref:metal ABC transporter substrate-binding protein n=1 Tax=Enterococcus sp. CWB-B31 TaxID=2885159 RepID=UPI001E3651E5|nr:metal ABC transporter substrate-binding protein [Enterococcus sp. CWB-B31]MCB5956093.1 metal ABC transporter substrate-binding protein [Enterococcus sp. CWB-B31]
MKRKFLKYSMCIGMLLLGIFILAACGETTKPATDKQDQITVMTTFYPMYNFTKEIVGDEGTVELLIPSGTDAHDFEPSAKDIAKVSDADLFVYNSNEFETWAEDVISNINQNSVKIVEASKGIDLMESDDHDHEEEEEEHDHSHEVDPHVWLNPVLVQKEVETIRDALVSKYPDKKEVFEANAAAYLEKLQTLDAEYRTAFAAVENRTFVTQHAAFGYLAKEYGLIQESISGISPDQEPSPSRLAELKKYIDEHQVKVIYFEATASSKVAETLAKETGVELSVLQTLESLTEEEQQSGQDYISVMQENLEALKKSIK